MSLRGGLGELRKHQIATSSLVYRCLVLPLESQMSFKFVDNECIDRKTRRLIRSHVAKGKNLGKTLHRQRSRTKVPGQAGGTLATTTTTDRVNASAEEALMLDIPTLPAPERMLSRSMATPSINAKLSPAAFPLGLTSQSRRSLEKCQCCHSRLYLLSSDPWMLGFHNSGPPW